MKSEAEIIEFLNTENIGPTKYSHLWCSLNARNIPMHWSAEMYFDVMKFIEYKIGKKACLKQWNKKHLFKKQRQKILSRLLFKNPNKTEEVSICHFKRLVN